MKALFVLPEYGYDVRGGIARFYEHAISGLQLAGCKVEVCVTSYTPSDGNSKDVPVRTLKREDVDAAAEKLSHLALFPTLQHQLASAFAAFKACSGGDGFDIVETTDWGLLYVPWLADSHRRAAVVVQMHGSPGQISYRDPFAEEELSALLTRMLEVAYLPRADDLQTSGAANAAEWQKLLGRNVRQILPAWSIVSATPTPPASNAFGMVGARLQSWKGPEILCQASRALGDKSPTILWAGGDHPFESLDQSMSSYLARKYPGIWGKKIIPLGSQARDITRSIQRAAGFVVHPSSWDVFGLAVVEAMEAGKVVICSDQAGVSCLIEHGKNGFVYPADDVSRLAGLLGLVANLDSQTLSLMGNRARQCVKIKLDAQEITKARLAAYASLHPRPCGPTHPWLENAFAPKGEGQSSQNALLGRLPLKSLLAHVGKRLVGRLRSTKAEVPWLRSLPQKDVLALIDRLTEMGVE